MIQLPHDAPAPHAHPLDMGLDVRLWAPPPMDPAAP